MHLESRPIRGELPAICPSTCGGSTTRREHARASETDRNRRRQVEKTLASSNTLAT
jgi:hypothetical protein